nr:glycosyltransferase [uncultured Pseudoxanthomonas sp.]
MSRPSICVCVATYNQCQYIEVCLRSILDQHVDAELEVLVGDDASTDGTSDIVERLATEYGGRLRHHRRSENVGALANMRDLLGRAHADFVARVDGDDYWLPGKLSRQLEYLRVNAECSAVYTNGIVVGRDGSLIGLFNDVGDESFNLAAMLRRGNYLNNSSVLFRGQQVAGWTVVPEQIDYQVHLWLARYGWLGHIGSPLVAYRVGSHGSMVSSSGDLVRELYWQAIQSVSRDLVSDADYAHGIADFLRRIFFRSVRTRDFGLFRAWAARIYPASPYGYCRTTSLVAINIVRMGLKIAIGQLRPKGYRHVLYRR